MITDFATSPIELERQKNSKRIGAWFSQNRCQVWALASPSSMVLGQTEVQMRDPEYAIFSCAPMASQWFCHGCCRVSGFGSWKLPL